MSSPVSTKASEDATLIAVLTPVSFTASTALTSGYVNAKNFHKAQGIVTVGANGQTAAMTVQVLKSSDTNGTGAAVAVSGTLGSTANLRTVVNWNSDQHADDDKPYIALRLVPGGVSATAAVVSGVLLGQAPRYAPGTPITGTTIAN